ncbi:transketolase [Candidatus Woesearchaeota archaeon]|nr:transketolase [Candidatus Woesearchaeota archaeon]
MARFQKVTDIKQLRLIANTVRQDIIKSLVSAGSGHSGGPLGMADVFTVLYFNILNHDPAKPDWEGRDRLILSNGHICPVRYAAMANAGYFPKEELLTLRKLGTRLQGHPHRTALPGVETTSGPLGSGLSQSAGLAYAGLMDKKAWRVYCLTSDGEHESGQTWEAALFAGNNKLRNLTCVIDRNNIQIDGHTEDVMPLEPLKAKYEAFGWHVIEVDGHNHDHLMAAFHEAEAVYEKPTCIIAHTIPGKGVSFMENDHEWHGKPPTKEQGEVALTELQHWRQQIEAGVD